MCEKASTKIDVLTYATNYDYTVFERFVGSLNDTGFKGNIYIIVKSTDLPKINLLQLKYTNVYSLLDDVEVTTAVHNHRFFVKKKYVDMLLFKSDYLLLCDFRDVLFQKNIENYGYDNTIDLYGFLEGIKINQDMNCNTPWIKRLEVIFNEEIYDKISNETVICSGTTIGTTTGIKQYLDTLCNIILKYNITEILDQGIHMYMLYMQKLPGMKIKLLSNEDNLVNTVGCDVHKLDENHNIVNKNNDISYIVHQYDRFSAELKQKISDKYGYNFNSDTSPPVDISHPLDTSPPVYISHISDRVKMHRLKMKNVMYNKLSNNI